jgi:hypothetical protein
MHKHTAAALAAAVLLPLALSAQIRAGAAKRTITPDLEKHGPVYMAGFGNNRKATAVHDDLYARCVALSAGGRPLAICAVDLIGLFWDDARKIRAKVQAADVIVSSLHVHEGPDTMGQWGPSQAQSGINEAYMSFVVDRVAEAAQEAIKSMRPARLRAARTKPAELDTFIDDGRPPIVHDAEVIVLRAETAEGQPIATLINWANHPETLGSKNTQITSDYSGYLRDELERQIGGTAVFVNGAVGGMQSPLGSKVNDAQGKLLAENTFEKAEFIGNRVATLAAEALKNAPVLNVNTLVFREKTIEIPMANPGFQMASKAGIFRGRKEPTASGANVSPVGYVRLAQGSEPQLEIALIPGEMYPELSVGGIEKLPGSDYPDAPFESPIKQQMKAPFRMLFGLADDEIGYIIPRVEWDEKAPYLANSPKKHYGEINSVGPDAAPLIVKAFSELLQAK